MADIPDVANLKFVPGGAGPTLSDPSLPFRTMERLGGSWIHGASQAERFETLLDMLRVNGHSENFIAEIEKRGPGILKMSQARIPVRVMRMAGGKQKQALFTQALELTRKYPKGVPKKVMNAAWRQAISIAEGSGLDARYVETLKKAGPGMFKKYTGAQILATYDKATRVPFLQNVWNKMMRTSPPPGLPTEAKAAWTESLGKKGFEGAAREALPEGAGRVRRAGRAIAEGADVVRGKLQPGGLTAEKGVMQGLRAAGVKGVSAGASLLRSAGTFGSVLGAGFLGVAAYHQLVGRQKAARSALDAYNKGQGKTNMSMEIIRDVLSKREAIEARRAMLMQNPNMSQQVIEALSEISGVPRQRLTSSEIGLGAAARPPQRPSLSKEQLDAMLDQLMMQVGGG